MKKQSKVNVNNWIAFWFKEDERHPSPKKQAKKGLHPKCSQNPSGLILDRGPQKDKEHTALFDLQVPKDLKKETYLVAFLACWLCVFTFPIKDFVLVVRTYVFHLLRTYVMILYNWLIL